VRPIREATTALGAVTTAQDRARLSAQELAAAERERAAAVKGGLVQLGRGAALMGAFAVAESDYVQQSGLANTATYALMGTLAGPWGAAAGAAVGLTLDMAAANRDLEEALRDAAVAIHDQSTSFEEAQQRLEAAKAKLDDMQHSTKWTQFVPVAGPYLTEWFDKTDEAKAKVQELERELDDKLPVSLAGSASAIRGHGAAFRDYADDARAAMQADYDFLGSLDAINEKLQDRADLRAYRQALRDFRKAIKDAPEDMRHGSKAWDEVEAMLDGIASSALAVADTMNEVDRIKFLDKARGEFIKAAKQMGLTRKQARELADELGLLDKNDPRVRIDVDTDEAEAAVHRFRGLLDGLDGDTAETFIRVTTEHMDVRLGGPKVATGGYISGPGGPTDDKIPAWLSNGEYVIRAAAVDKYGVDALHAINAMRFAEGGYALAAGGTLPNLTRKDA
jgi:hypothetical protein